MTYVCTAFRAQLEQDQVQQTDVGAFPLRLPEGVGKLFDRVGAWGAYVEGN